MTATRARLEARIDPDVHSLIKQAAALRGSTVTDFVVTAARVAAQQTVEDATLLRLSREDQRRFAEALMAPPQAEPALRRARDHRKRLLTEG